MRGKPGTGGFPLHPEPTDLSALVRQVAERLEPPSGQHRILVTAPDHLVGHWDPDRLGQVLTNQIGNAIKYSPDGGDVIVQLRQDRDGATITVADQGIGIRADEVHLLFRPFSRLSDGARLEGTGLGLFISRGIIEAHGGRISVESDGQGAGQHVHHSIAGDRITRHDRARRDTSLTTALPARYRRMEPWRRHPRASASPATSATMHASSRNVDVSRGPMCERRRPDCVQCLKASCTAVAASVESPPPSRASVAATSLGSRKALRCLASCANPGRAVRRLRSDVRSRRTASHSVSTGLPHSPSSSSGVGTMAEPSPTSGSSSRPGPVRWGSTSDCSATSTLTQHWCSRADTSSRMGSSRSRSERLSPTTTDSPCLPRTAADAGWAAESRRAIRREQGRSPGNGADLAKTSQSKRARSGSDQCQNHRSRGAEPRGVVRSAESQLGVSVGVASGLGASVTDDLGLQ